jgi:hypothetical protein
MGLGVTRWRVWFVGGHTYDGETFNDWASIPDDGVLSVMLWFDDGTRRVMQGNDFYFATPGGVYGHNDHPQQETERRYPGASVKRGQWTTDAEMEHIAREAIEAT